MAALSPRNHAVDKVPEHKLSLIEASRRFLNPCSQRTTQQRSKTSSISRLSTSGETPVVLPFKCMADGLFEW